MAMEISSNYSNYANSCTNAANYTGSRSNAANYTGSCSNAANYAGSRSNAANYTGSRSNAANYAGSRSNAANCAGSCTNAANYTNSCTNAAAGRKKTAGNSTAQQTAADAVSEAKTAGEKKTGNAGYLSELNQRHSSLNIMAGGVNKNYNSGNYPKKVDVMIAPSILEKMASDPEEAQKYEKMLSDIPMCEKWANSAIKAMTGNEVKYRQVWIDENGNMGSFSISGPSEKQQKMDAQRKENEKKAFEERLEKRREKARENTIQLEERFEKKREASRKAEKLLSEKLENAENGEIYLDNKDMLTIIKAAEDDHTGRAAAEGTMAAGANLDIKA